MIILSVEPDRILDSSPAHQGKNGHDIAVTKFRGRAVAGIKTRPIDQNDQMGLETEVRGSRVKKLRPAVGGIAKEVEKTGGRCSGGQVEDPLFPSEKIPEIGKKPDFNGHGLPSDPVVSGLGIQDERRSWIKAPGSIDFEQTMIRTGRSARGPVR
jgi:hypothetical protein